MAGSSTHDIFYGTVPQVLSDEERSFPQQQQFIGGPTMRFVPSMPSPEMRMADVAAELESDPS